MNYQIAFYLASICFFIVASIAIYLLSVVKGMEKSICDLQGEVIEQRKDFIDFLDGLKKRVGAINLNESLNQGQQIEQKLGSWHTYLPIG